MCPLDGREPLPYQWDTTRFIEKADCNGLILHEQGLGKTVIACMLLKRNKDLLPALIVCPSGLRLQWLAETIRWTGTMPQVITSSNDKPMFEVFPIVLVSIDTLRLLRPDVGGVEDGFEFDNGFKPSRPLRNHCGMMRLSVSSSLSASMSAQKIKNSGSSRLKHSARSYR